ncbi:MAG: septation regulator SpoVG [Spirochaetaceae bacterium]|jgi:stage V sporulation protein G|nr:septation regulator SpoVG [Spirochaetaceae bacterium]
MEVTDVRIRLALGDGKLRAYAAVTFDNCFVVHNIKILEGANGFFLAMPSRKTGSGGKKDVAHPLNGEFRAMLQEKILEKYHVGIANGEFPQTEYNAPEEF